MSIARALARASVKYAPQRMDLCGRLADGGGHVTEGRLKRLSLLRGRGLPVMAALPARGLAGRALARVFDRAEASASGVDGLPRHEVGHWVPAFSLTLDLDSVASHADDEGAALNKDGIELADNLPAQ